VRALDALAKRRALGMNVHGRALGAQLEQHVVLSVVATVVACTRAHALGEWTDDSVDAAQQGRYRVVEEQHVAHEELGHDAAERPDVDLAVVRQADHDLGRSVRARLHVRAQVVGREARRAKVDDLDLTAAVALDENVLGLEVAMDD